tara:strand:- start:854 stop:2164 length:1311 start_codon:yes stop_codon:yes gene_type:complete
MVYIPLTDNEKQDLNDIKKNKKTFKFIQENKKFKDAKLRYGKYKSATNYEDFIKLGGNNKDLRNDLQKGYIYDIIEYNNSGWNLKSGKVDIEKSNNNIKKDYGQFYTKNYEYILQNIKIPNNIKKIIEPFAGECDLLNYINNQNNYEIELYDIDPKKDNTTKRDTLMDPPSYKDKYVITNPPYLARNKSTDKELFDKYDVNDLYKCFIINIINDVCQGGIIIIPLNFICSIRKKDIELRKKFLNIYKIELVNIFEESVFNDTSTTVCSIKFIKKNNKKIYDINIDIYPSKKNIKVKLNNKNNYTIGGDIYILPKPKNYNITRLMTRNLNEKNTNIVVKCVDCNSNDMIKMEIKDDDNLFIDNTEKHSARGHMTLIITPPISNEKQKKLVLDFNNYIKDKRKQYNSLFLPNFRESSDIARKRIPFDLVYKITEHLLN